MAAAPQAAAATPTDVDVVVVGSGIIGLLITRQLLLSSELSVALFDLKQPCAGATGAGTCRTLDPLTLAGRQAAELAVVTT